jgi:hypothetical protein
MTKDDGIKVCFYGQIILTIFGFVMKGKLIEQNRKKSWHILRKRKSVLNARQ